MSNQFWKSMKIVVTKAFVSLFGQLVYGAERVNNGFLVAEQQSN